MQFINRFFDAAFPLVLVRRAKGCTNNQGPRYEFIVVGYIHSYFEIPWGFNPYYQVTSLKLAKLVIGQRPDLQMQEHAAF